MVVDEVEVGAAELLAGLGLHNRQPIHQLAASLVVKREITQSRAYAARQRLRHVPQRAGQPAHTDQLADLHPEGRQGLDGQGPGHQSPEPLPDRPDVGLRTGTVAAGPALLGQFGDNLLK